MTRSGRPMKAASAGTIEKVEAESGTQWPSHLDLHLSCETTFFLCVALLLLFWLIL